MEATDATTYIHTEAMNKKQAKAAMLKSFNANRRDNNVGWFYVNKASVDVYCSLPGEPARTCRLTRRHLEMALRIMKGASSNGT